MLKNTILLITATIIIGFMTSCSEDKYIPDVSDINIDVEINRFEQDLFAIDTTQINEGIAALQTKYPEFTDLFFQRIIPLDRPQAEPSFPENVKGFLTYPSIRALYDTTMMVFPDIQSVQNDLTSAFQFYKYYFPDRDTPSIYTFISEYSYQTFITQIDGKDAIGVGLDMFLGSDYPYRKYVPENPNFSEYLTRAFNKKHLTKKVMDTVIDDVVGLPDGKRLLDIMVNNGKKMYLLDLVLPETADSIKWEYTAQQIDWCQQNELALWTHLLKEDLLYETQNSKFRKLVEPSPSGPSNIPPASPGRAANWIGKAIIEAYMARHPNTDLMAMIREKDAQLILDKSRYRPKEN